MAVDLTIAVIAKEPRPGVVKTRLMPPCGPAEAAGLARAMLHDTLAAVAAADARRRLLVLDGAPGEWVPPGFDVVPQAAGTLDVRLAHALSVVGGPVVLIGMDTPQVTPALLDCDFAAHPAWLGPAVDGGYWAIGLSEPDPALVRGVPMSVPHTFQAQRRELVAAGLTVGELSMLRDVDTWNDAVAVAGDAPRTRFAETLAAMRVRGVG